MGKRSKEASKPEKTPKKSKQRKKLDPHEGEQPRVPVVQELDEISLQLREEKRKALEILDSIATGEVEEVVQPQEKVYNVNANLKQLFSNPAGGSFSFLGNNEVDSLENDHEDLESEKTEAPDSEASQDIEDFQDTPKYFFFHSGCKALRNRMDENSFYRTQTWEELESEWPTKRAAMKQSFRRRHKDALKFRKRKKG